MWKKPIEPELSRQPSTSKPVEPKPTQTVSKMTQTGTSIIGTSIILRGDITGEEDLIVKGKVEGTLTLPSNDIQVDPEGEVKADLKAQKISVAGKVQGNLVGSERVVIEKSGQVEGNIVAPRVVLEDGCKFKGSVEMNMDNNAASRLKQVTPDSSKTTQPSKTSNDSGFTRASGTT